MTTLRDRSNHWNGIVFSGLESSLRALRAAVSGGRSSRETAWVEELRTAIGLLKELNEKTEAGFLAIGGNLMAFLTASRQLHTDLCDLTAVVSGEQVQSAGAALVGVRRYFQEAQGRLKESSSALLGLRSSADAIRRKFASIGEIVVSFQVTAILARIESAHLARSQQDLGNLADEVSSCGNGIKLRAQHVLEAVSDFHACIASTLAEVSRLGAREQTELPSLLAAVDADLAVFEDWQRNLAASSSKMADNLGAVTRELGAVATAIQFHDITRQQVEHVIEALEEMLRDAAGKTLSARNAKLIRVQMAQLKSAAAAFAQSTQKIEGDLAEVAARVGGMSDASKSILGIDQREDSFLSGMRGRFASVREVVVHSLSSKSSAGAIIADLQTLSRRLRDSVGEIQVIELQLSRISINAAISASHIGPAGEPLNVVASAMQGLQVECASRSRDAEADLDAIERSILSLSGNGLDMANATNDSLPGDLKACTENLESASAGSGKLATRVIHASDKLCNSLSEARGHLKIRDLFAETVQRCCELLASAAAQCQPEASSHEQASEEPIEERYTMQSERAVHEAAASGGEVLPFDPTSIQEGEEVEFF